MSPLAGMDAAAAAAWIAEREQRIAAGLEAPTAFHIQQATRRKAFDTLSAWPQGRRIPRRLLTEAFEHAVPAQACLARDETQWRPQLDRALARYHRYRDQRPSNWPIAGEAALALAIVDVAPVAESALYAIGRLDQVTKQMAAAHKRAHHVDYETGRARRGDRRDQVARSAADTSRFHYGGRKSEPRTELEEARDILAGRTGPGDPTPEQIRLAGARLFVARELAGGEDLLGFHVRGDQLLRPDGQPPSTKFRDAVRWLRGLIDHHRHG